MDKKRTKHRQDSLCLDDRHDGTGESEFDTHGWLRPVSASAACFLDHDSDSQSEQSSPVSLIHRAYAALPLHAVPRFLPPVGVFWDIENCQVPKGRSAVAVAQAIRDRFFKGYREAEFLVVCDVKKENNQIVQELNDAQVNLIHVASTCKNAADEKLRQSIRRFADLHGSPACIILISGDINFAPDITDLRHRKKIHVILLHKKNTSEALILSANENYSFSALAEELPIRVMKCPSKPAQILVNNLPEDLEQGLIRNRLRRLSDNCGGKVAAINKTVATIRFPNVDFATRAQKRMDGEDVFGHKISVIGPNTYEKREPSPLKNQSARKNRLGSYREAEIHSAMSSISFKQATRHPQLAYHSTPSSLNLLGGSNVYNRHAMLQQDGKQQQQLPNPAGLIWPKLSSGVSAAPKLSNRSGDKTPEGYRRIRGTHKVSDSHQSETSSTSKSIQPASILKRCRTSSPAGSATTCMLSLPDPVATARQIIEQTVVGRGTSPLMQGHLARTSPQHTRTINGTTPKNPEHFFHPIPVTPKVQSNNSNGSSFDTPIELQVTNLDHNLSVVELKNILTALFKEYVMVCNVFMVVQGDGNVVGYVKVPSISDAQVAISHLHRYKIGYRRILISYGSTGGPSPQVIRSQVVTLLLEVPEHRLPLFKFREMFEKRYLSSISISDIYKLRDVCTVSDGPNGRMVALSPDHRQTPSPCLLSTQESQPYCTLHAMKPQPDRGWAEQELCALPSVHIGLKLLGRRVTVLLQSHGGSLPLPSLPYCYSALFGKLEVAEDGVPLEHLVSCLRDVKITPSSAGCVKRLVWAGDSGSESGQVQEILEKGTSPHLATQLQLLSRELVDLLKIQPGCQLAFGRFVPAYHHHFGRQIRVADYGFTKLIELLDALPNVVQVMGEGSRRIVTLAHKAQVRRFTSDLLRVLKSQASKQASVAQLPSLFTRTLGRQFSVGDYGVCELLDLLHEVSDNTVVLHSNADGGQVVAIPRREQTSEEIQRTKQFAAEVVELLSHAPQRQLMFNKLIPAYHHHFGKQCRVADFGFTKLIELLESIPDVVKVEDTGSGDRRVMLTYTVALRVLSTQVADILKTSGRALLHVSELPAAYLQRFGYTLRAEDFNCSSVEQLVSLLSSVKVLPGLHLALVDNNSPHYQRLRVLRVFLEAADDSMSLTTFQETCKKFYNSCLSEEELCSANLSMVVMVRGCYILLQPQYAFARKVFCLLRGRPTTIPLSLLDEVYTAHYNHPIQLAHLGFKSLASLVQAVGEVLVLVQGCGASIPPYITLNTQLADVGMTLPLFDSFNGVNQLAHLHSFTSANTVTDVPSKNYVILGICGTSQDDHDAAKIAEKTDTSNSIEPSLKNIVNSVSKEVLETDIHKLNNSVNVKSSSSVLHAWGGHSPPSYAPYCLNTAFSPYKGNGETARPSSRNWPEQVVPPDPSELPLPSPCLVYPEVQLQDQDTPSKQRRKRRLAAQFNTPLEMP